MGDLKVSIRESITLPRNKNEEICTNTLTISNVNQTTRRVDTITTTFSGSGQELVRFVGSEREQTAGSFVRDTVKYMRFTNLDETNFLTLYLIQNDGVNDSENLFKLDPGKSMIFSNGQFDGNSSIDYVVGGYVDSSYFSSLASLSLIKGKSNTSDIQIEYFLGTE